MDDPVLRASQCQHPPGFVMFTNHGMAVQCGACGLRQRVDRRMIDLLLADKAGGPPPPSDQPVYGPTFADVALQAKRLDLATRRLGKAFGRDARTREQDEALEFARSALDGFRDMKGPLTAMLNAALVSFRNIEIVPQGVGQ